MAKERIERALKGTPGAAQPSTIVATETAFARMAREEGQWKAFREFAAEDGLIHGRNGTVKARQVFASLREPDEAVQWRPKAVWMSCDGALAVSQGRFVDPEGIVGSYVTVWQRQDDLSYRYAYDMASPDDPQPAPVVEEAPLPGEIRVTTLDSVEGNVADCPKRGDGALPARPMAMANASGVSPDGTLAWRWVHLEGSRQFAAAWFNEGEWKTAVDVAWPSPDE